MRRRSIGTKLKYVMLPRARMDRGAGLREHLAERGEEGSRGARRDEDLKDLPRREVGTRVISSWPGFPGKISILAERLTCSLCYISWWQRLG